jgi:hypothetical protein
VKRRRLHTQLTERQQLILAMLLIILVAISLLYCLGLASLALRQVWRETAFPTNGVNPTEEQIDLTPTPLPAESPLPATPLP